MRVEKDSASSPSTHEVSEQQIEAARYAVLRRLWASLRHRMVKPLQPIVLSYGLMKHELAAAEPDLQTLRTQADKGKEFAEAAVAQCVDFGPDWRLSPEYSQRPVRASWSVSVCWQQTCIFAASICSMKSVSRC